MDHHRTPFLPTNPDAWPSTLATELVVVQIPQTLIGSIKTGFMFSLSGLFEREERDSGFPVVVPDMEMVN